MSDPRRATRRDRELPRITAADIARLAGVSAPTVSRVINGQSGVAVDTRRRIEAVMREHGYLRAPAHSPVAILELVFYALDSPWALEVIRGVEQVAREQQLAVVLTESHGHITPGRAWTEQVLARQPTGVIAVLSSLTYEQRSQLASRSIPVVVVDPTGEPQHATPSVGATNWSGGLAATRHLLELGHERIGLVNGPLELLCYQARLGGYRAAMSAAGVSIDPELVRSSNSQPEDGLQAGRELLRLPQRPTAIFASTDMLALGVYEAARELDLRIPGDLSVVGFDDLPLSQWSGPPLTTVRQPLMQMGATAARMLVALASGDRLPDERVELATTLIVRHSTAPPRLAD